MNRQVKVVIEATPKKAFATAIDWPGWSRSGKTAELSLEALARYGSRYAVVASDAGESFPDDVTTGSFDIVEEAEGGSGTEFGVPSRVTKADRRRVTAVDADRLRRLVSAAWATFDRVAAGTPASLRKGPRGGGRDRDKMIGHVVEADQAYAREIGLGLRPPAPDNRTAIEAMRAAMLEIIGSPSDGSPLADRRWTTRYAAGRIAWHALDHAWEMEDRSEGVEGPRRARSIAEEPRNG